jgi:hypothetical protein
MRNTSYLSCFGKAGEFGVFSCTEHARYARGEKVVMSTYRGVELGRIMREGREGHARLLTGTPVGKIMRRATREDSQLAASLEERARAIFEEGRRFASSSRLSIEILDTEILFDSQSAIVYFLRQGDCDPGLLVNALSEREGVRVLMHDLGPNLLRAGQDDAEFAQCGGGTCGEGGCGSCSAGNCSSCQSHHSARRPALPADLARTSSVAYSSRISLA